MIDNIISVIIPCYRMEAYIVRAVHSLLAQTYPHWRAVIVSDDGVDYVAYLAHLGITDERLQHATTQGVGTGLSHARNVGLRAIAGSDSPSDYVATLDADDAYHETRLADIVSLLAQHPLIMTGMHYCDDVTGDTIPTPLIFASDQIIPLHQAPRIMICGAATWCFNRHIIRHEWYEQVRSLEDQLWTLQAYNTVNKIYYAHAPSYHYYRRAGSLSQATDTPQNFIREKQRIIIDIESGAIALQNDMLKQTMLRFFTLSLKTEQEYANLTVKGTDKLFADLAIARLKEAGMWGD